MSWRSFRVPMPLKLRRDGYKAFAHCQKLRLTYARGCDFIPFRGGRATGARRVLYHVQLIEPAARDAEGRQYK